MDLKNLSSNWKKLQGTLQKRDNVSASAPTKRKISERESQDGAVKKRKRDAKEDTKKSNRPVTSAKRKRMSEGGDNEVSELAVKSTSRRNSTAAVTAPEKADLPKAKVNEGRSSRSVILQSVSTVYHCVCADFSNIPIARN